MEEKFKLKKTGIPRLLEIAGEKRSLLIISGIFSVISTCLMFIPFLSIYFIAAELLKHAAKPSQSDIILIQNWGLTALVSLIVALIFLYASTMASHISAFRILYNLRIRLTEHLSKLPMGLPHATILWSYQENARNER